MKKSLPLALGLVILFASPSGAVLKESGLGSTLANLRGELTTYHREQVKESSSFLVESEMVRDNILSILSQSNQNALMLYSQKPGYVFDLAYACRQATEQYRDFKKNSAPFRSVIDNLDSELARYDSLITTLRMMPSIALNQAERNDRSVCLSFAINIRRSLEERKATFSEYIYYYDITERRLAMLNDYANERYSQIQAEIFQNVGTNYFTILSRFGTYLASTGETVEEKYQASSSVSSQWDARMMLGLFCVILLYALVAAAVNFLAVRYLIPRRFQSEGFMAKRACITAASAAVTFAVLMGIIKATVDQNFIVMACGLLVEFAWLFAAIVISLLLRVEGKSIMSAFNIYLPLLVVGFLVITFRIILVPNSLANLVFPPILLFCLIWQWFAIRTHSTNIPRNDVIYTYVSLFIFVVSVVTSWVGYTLMSVQLLIWWLMQLACLLTINCITVWAHRRQDRLGVKTMTVSKGWAYHFFNQVVIPLMAVISVLVSIYWAADVFNLSEYTRTIFTMNLIDEESFCLSLFSMVMVTALWFVASFLSKLGIAIVRQHFDGRDPGTAASRVVMGKNLINILVWGIWLIVSLAILHVSSTWIVVISGGLSTGVGFASKDIIENFYYGISLMAGRVKIGDWIECDGTRGKVASISYTSTMIEAIDGSIIAFQNSQLFTKNYKNLTRNHGYVLSIIPFGVAYGTDAKRVSEIIVEKVKAMDCPYLDKSMGVRTRFVEFGDSSIDFKLLCWVDVIQQANVESDIRELIYDVLNTNGIEIPFPQRDLHIKDAPAGLA